MKSKFFALIAIGSSFIAGALLAPVLAETSDDVAREARNFRIQAYLTHHADRVAYDRYRNIGDIALNAWIDAKTPADRAAETAAWFRSAREALTNGGPLPGELDFSTPVKGAIAQTPDVTENENVIVEKQVEVAPDVPAANVAPTETSLPDDGVTSIPTQNETKPDSADQSSRGPGAAILRAFARAIASNE